MLFIHERPKEVESRAVLRILERVLKTALGVLVERNTRFVFMVPLEGKNTKDVIEALAHHFLDVTEKLKMSLTYDRGKEMVEH